MNIFFRGSTGFQRLNMVRMSTSTMNAFGRFITSRDGYYNSWDVVADKSRDANAFLDRYRGRRLAILELGIGSRNRLIKRPLMQLAACEPYATYITLNLAHELYIPAGIAHKSVGLEGDMAVTLRALRRALS